MKKKGLILLIGILCMVFICTLAPNIQAASEEPIYGGTLNVGWVTGAKTLDPHKSVQWPERYVLYCIYDTLVDLDEAFNVRPRLAESWEMPEPKTMIFHLQQGVKFHDDTEFDAEAVKWNIERVMNPDFASPHRQLLNAAVESLEVKDKYTIIFHLKKPSPTLLSALAERPGFMVSPTAVQKMGDKKFALNPVGSGPFKFNRWIQQSELTVVKNESYWQKGKPYLDKIAFKEIPDPVVRETQLQAGTIDIITDIVAKQAVDLQKEGKFTVVKKWPPARWYAMQWQVDKEPFNNKALREAIAYGIDPEEINTKLMYGEAMPPIGPVPPGLWWFEEGSKGYTYNPELAKKKLAEAGYPNGVSFPYMVSNLQFHIQMSEILQAQLKKIGVEMEFYMVPHTESYSLQVSGKSNWGVTNWTQRSDPDGLLRILFHSAGHANSTHYSNPRVDELLDQAANIYDPEKRKPLYYEAVRIITEDTPYVYLFYNPEWAIMSPKVHGFVWIPDLVPRYAFLWKEK